jgi:hypothetical protein
VDDELWFRVKKPQELKCRLFFSFYITGYNNDVPFSKMPNIMINTKKDKVTIDELVSRKRLSSAGSSALLRGKYFILKIPLRTLGDPDFILACVVTDKTFLPLDSAGFRKIKILDKELSGTIKK